MDPYRLILLLAGLAGLSAVLFGAAGSHLLEGLENPQNRDSWQTANLFHLLHAVTLLALAALFKTSSDRLLLFAALAFATGICLFSGSIYLSLLSDIESTRRLAPVGGMLLMLGWALLIFHSLQRKT